MWLSRRATHNRVNLVRREVRLIQMATSGSIIATGLRPRIDHSRVAQHGMRFDALGSQPVRVVKEAGNPVRLGAAQPKPVGHVGHCQMQQRSAASSPLGDRADEELAQHAVIRNGRQKANGAFAVLCYNDAPAGHIGRPPLGRHAAFRVAQEVRAVENQPQAAAGQRASPRPFREVSRQLGPDQECGVPQPPPRAPGGREKGGAPGPVSPGQANAP